MGVILAKKTLEAIETALRKDQGARFRKELGIAITQCADAFNPNEESPFRSHLGASILGRDCARQLWYNFRWAKPGNHIGRTIRLFNRGHLEEARFVALLRMIDIKVWQVDDQNRQFRVSHFGGHYGSAIDGVVSECPDRPNKPGVTEFKTYNDKNFQKLKKEGVRSAKYEHFIQMIQYMGYHKLPYSLYIAVNKNDDELYAEIVEFEEENYNQFLDRAYRVVFSPEPPPRISDNSASFVCKFCDYRDICFKGHAPARNCRTCVHALPLNDGQWGCQLHKIHIDKERQLTGCNNWNLIARMVENAAPQLPDFSGGLGLGLLPPGQ